MEIAPYIRLVQFYETDQMAVVHHANYIYWMEEARTDYMEKLGFGYDRAVAAGIDFALLGITCKYKGMCRFREQVKIVVTIRSITPTRLTVGYKMFGVMDGTLRFSGESEHCYWSNPRQRPVLLSKEIPELFALFTSITAPNNI